MKKLYTCTIVLGEKDSDFGARFSHTVPRSALSRTSKGHFGALLSSSTGHLGSTKWVFYTAHVRLLLWEPYRIGILAGQIHRSLSSTPVLSYLVKNRRGFGRQLRSLFWERFSHTVPILIGTSGCKGWFSIAYSLGSCSGQPIKIGFWAGRYIEGEVLHLYYRTW